MNKLIQEILSLIPVTLWRDDLLHLTPNLIEAHRSFLTEKDLLSQYDPKNQGGKGGATVEEATTHVINRFLNSAARVQYVCTDPKNEDPTVRRLVLDQLAEGRVYILDIAAGNGAGTLSILALLCELRSNLLVPKLPVNVTILAIDCSPTSLNYYAELLHEITPWLQRHGIEVSLELHTCDIQVAAEYLEIIDDIFDKASANKVNRFFCVLSAISGAGKEELEKMHASFQTTAAKLANKNINGAWLWVEPYIGKNWATKFFNSILLTFKKIPYFFNKKGESYEIIPDSIKLMDELNKRDFSWFDPYLEKSTHSHAVVLLLHKE